MSTVDFKTGVIKPVDCYKEGWELIKGQYWLLFAISLVGMMISGVIPIVLAGPMICGIFLCYFECFDGKEVKFESLFKGFEYFLPSLILSLIIIGPMMIILLLIYIPFIAVALTGPRMSEGELTAFLAGTIVFEVIFALIMVCIHTLLMFAFPLMVDRKLGVMDSIKTSVRAVWANLSGVVGLFVVGFVVALAGYALLCIGIYFAIPILFAGNLAAYRKVFPALNSPLNVPPSPSSYSGAGSHI